MAKHTRDGEHNLDVSVVYVCMEYGVQLPRTEVSHIPHSSTSRPDGTIIEGTQHAYGM